MFHWIKRGKRIESALSAIYQRLNQLHAKVNNIMAVQAETARVISEIDAETTRIGNKFNELVTNSDLTAEEKDKFTALITKLKAIGADPENPVPA